MSYYTDALRKLGIYRGREPEAVADTLPARARGANGQFRSETGVGGFDFPDETLGMEGGSLFSKIFQMGMDDDRREQVYSKSIARKAITRPINDAIKQGFVIENIDTKETPDNQKSQRALKFYQDKILPDLKLASVLSAVHGRAYIHIVYRKQVEGDSPALAAPIEGKPTKIETIPKTWIKEIRRDKATGELLMFVIDKDKAGLDKDVEVHPSRMIELLNMEIDVTTGKYGASTIDAIASSTTVQEAISYASMCIFWRLGAGLLLAEIPSDLDDDDEKEVINRLSNLNVKTVLTVPEGWKITLANALQSTLNPREFYDISMSQISAQTGIPKTILYGLSAGSITGSELDRKNYVDNLVPYQDWLRPPLARILEAFGYLNIAKESIRWLIPKVTTAKEDLEMEKIEAETEAIKVISFLKTPDEFRAEAGLANLTEKDLTLLERANKANQGTTPQERQKEQAMKLSKKKAAEQRGAAREGKPAKDGLEEDEV